MEALVLSTAKAVLCGINDIQSDISMSGMTRETRELEMMKLSMRKIIENLSRVPNQSVDLQKKEEQRLRLKQIVSSCSEDVMSHAVSLAGCLYMMDETDMENDFLVKNAILASEAFAKCSRNYLQNKELVEDMYGE